MIGRNVQVWLATQPVDMRKSFDGLAEVVRAFLGHDPLGGSLFVFRNRNAQRVKILWYAAGGLTIYYKRLACWPGSASRRWGNWRSSCRRCGRQRIKRSLERTVTDSASQSPSAEVLGAG